MQKRELKRHMTISCLWRITECEHCNEQHPVCRIQVVYDDHIYGESLYYLRNIHKLGFRSELKCSGLAESSVITAHAIPESYYMRDVKHISFRISWKVLEVPDNLSKRLWSVNSKGTSK